MRGTAVSGSGFEPERSGRRVASGIRSLAAPTIVALVAALTVGLLTLGTSVAAVAVPTPTPSPTPSPTPNSTESTSAPTLAPTITSPAPGSFVGSGSTTVSGTGEIGREIQLLSPVSGQDPLCFAVVDAAAEWSCTAVALPSGPEVLLRVVVTGAAQLAAEQTIAVLSAPVVTGGPTGLALTNGTVRGSGYPAASVVVSLAGGKRCTATADASGAWSCTFTGNVANGSVAVSASQQTSYSNPSWSNASAPVSLDFDLNRPNAPTVSAPVGGDQVPLTGTTYSGSGEDGATVTVFAGAYSVCTAVVVSGSWSCAAGGVAAGSHRVIAVQRDPAGNLGPGSPGVEVLFGAAATVPPGSAGPATPVPTQGATTPPSAAAPTPESTGPATPAPGQGSPSPQAGPPSVVVPAPVPGGWNDPTLFATAVAVPWSTSQVSWAQAALLAFGALLLLCVPARLLAGTVSRARNGRPLWQTVSIAGRNRTRVEFETAPDLPLNRWLVAGAAVMAAATLVMLSGTVSSQPAYLRLLVAVMAALVVVNAVGTLVPLWWSSRVWRERASVTFLPRYLLLVAVTALASRAFEIHPALVFGLLGSVAAAPGLPGLSGRRRGQLAAVRAGSLTALAAIGWLLLGLLPRADGFLSAFAAEIANSVVLAAIGSAALVLIPIGRTSGRSILAWSPPIWAALTVLAFTIMFGVLSPAGLFWPGDGSVSLWWAGAGVFAALSVGAWAWQRFVVPARH